MGKSVHEMTDEERLRLFPVILCEHDPVWKENYEKEKMVLEQAIGAGNIARINHYGSTAIPGLIAKPTIDILLEIKDDADLEKLIVNVQSVEYGYIELPSRPAPHMMFAKGYSSEGFKGQVFHIHVRYKGDWDELYFRDYLLAHPEIAYEYGEFKKELKKKYEFNRDEYTYAKTDFIRRITKMAREEIPCRY
jgi:GrpB-like predicted nucleotidyltransferase (UPF0157 family)